MSTLLGVFIPGRKRHLKRCDVRCYGGAKGAKALLMFDFQGSRDLTWISSAERSGMVKMLRELADRLDRDTAGGPVAPSTN